MKHKMFVFLMCLVILMVFPITARADIGLNPSLRIGFTGIEGETYYGKFGLTNSQVASSARS